MTQPITLSSHLVGLHSFASVIHPAELKQAINMAREMETHIDELTQRIAELEAQATTAKDIGELCHQQVSKLIASGNWTSYQGVVDYVVQQAYDFKRENKPS